MSTEDKPGYRDAQNFQLHWSVDFWRDFTVPPTIADANAPIPSRYYINPASRETGLLQCWCYIGGNERIQGQNQDGRGSRDFKCV